MSQVLTMLPDHVRIDGWMCDLRESVKGDLVWRPWRIQSKSRDGFEDCDAVIRIDMKVVQRFRTGGVQGERRAKEIIGWLSEESVVMNP